MQLFEQSSIIQEAIRLRRRELAGDIGRRTGRRCAAWQLALKRKADVTLLEQRGEVWRQRG